MRTTRRIVISALGALAIAASGLALRPSNARQERRRSPLLEGARIDGATLDILERACQECHSDRTRWPWYSYIPPASILIHRDVDAARANMNLSRWQDYTPAQRQALLSAMGAAARNGTMPPGRYTAIHPAARLTSAERDQFYRWTRAERRRATDPVQSAPKTREMTLYAERAERVDPPGASR